MTDQTQQNARNLGRHPHAFAWVSMLVGPSFSAFLMMMLFNGSALSQLFRDPSWFYFSAAFYQPTLISLAIGACALPVSGFFLWRLLKNLPAFETFPGQFFVLNATMAGAIFGFLLSVMINFGFELFSSKPDIASIRGEMFISVVISTIMGAMLSFVASHICLAMGRLAKWIN
jgi:hypothetical protein